MINIVELINQTPGWVDTGNPFSDVVISSRVRLARNLQSLKFVERASENELLDIIDRIQDTIQHIGEFDKSNLLFMDHLTKNEKAIFHERRVITSGFVESEKPREFALLPDETVSLMINEEDHLRLQSIQSGFQLKKAWKIVQYLEQKFSDSLTFSYSDEFGFLTSNPGDLGSGVRFSVYAHLPALKLTKEIENVFESATTAGLFIQGVFGEEKESIGSYFQISNQYTLGWDENDLLERIIQLIEYLIEKERSAREYLLAKNPIVIEDKVFRALGVLQYARMISTLEFLELLSALRLGIDLNLLPDLKYNQLDELMILCQPYHLQEQENRKLDKIEIDRLRADFIRSRINMASKKEK